jgi:hypothetical protein
VNLDHLAYPNWYGTEWDTLGKVAVPADTLCGCQRFRMVLQPFWR